MSIDEILALVDPPQRESTCPLKVERISFMFKWALEDKRKWVIDANPFTGYSQAKRTAEVRRSFTKDEFRSLLGHPDFLARKFTNSYSFWLIPLATYTGARLGELAQLDVNFTVSQITSNRAAAGTSLKLLGDASGDDGGAQGADRVGHVALRSSRCREDGSFERTSLVNSACSSLVSKISGATRIYFSTLHVVCIGKAVAI